MGIDSAVALLLWMYQKSGEGGRMRTHHRSSSATSQGVSVRVVVPDKDQRFIFLHLDG